MNNPVCIEEDVISGIHILISKLIRKEDWIIFPIFFHVLSGLFLSALRNVGTVII
jgi:hypothetical protein